MQPPKQVAPTRLGDYLGVMTKAVFESGMSWRVVETKWEGFQEAFGGFDPVTVASVTPEDVERLVENTRIIRNRGRSRGR